MQCSLLERHPWFEFALLFNSERSCWWRSKLSSEWILLSQEIFITRFKYLMWHKKTLAPEDRRHQRVKHGCRESEVPVDIGSPSVSGPLSAEECVYLYLVSATHLAENNTFNYGRFPIMILIFGWNGVRESRRFTYVEMQYWFWSLSEDLVVYFHCVDWTRIIQQNSSYLIFSTEGHFHRQAQPFLMT